MGDLAGGLRAPLDVGVTAVLAENKSPMLIMETRYDYLMKNLLAWKDYIRYRVYAVIAAVLTAILIFSQPLLAVIAAFLTTYCWKMHKFYLARTMANTRTVMLGH